MTTMIMKFINGIENNKNGQYHLVIRKNKIQKTRVNKIIDSSGYVTKVVSIWQNVKAENIAATSQIPPLSLLIQGAIVKLLLENKKTIGDIKNRLPADEHFESIEKQYLIEKCRHALSKTQAKIDSNDLPGLPIF